MSEEAARTGGIFLPYPLLGIIMTLVVALGGGMIGLYSQLSAMNATMIMRDQDAQRRIDDLKKQMELQGVYMSDLREKVIRLEERKGPKS